MSDVQDVQAEAVLSVDDACAVSDEEVLHRQIQLRKMELAQVRGAGDPHTAKVLEKALQRVTDRLRHVQVKHADCDWVFTDGYAFCETCKVVIPEKEVMALQRLSFYEERRLLYEERAEMRETIAKLTLELAAKRESARVADVDAFARAAMEQRIFESAAASAIVFSKRDAATAEALLKMRTRARAAVEVWHSSRETPLSRAADVEKTLDELSASAKKAQQHPMVRMLVATISSSVADLPRGVVTRRPNPVDLTLLIFRSLGNFRLQDAVDENVDIDRVFRTGSCDQDEIVALFCAVAGHWRMTRPVAFAPKGGAGFETALAQVLVDADKDDWITVNPGGAVDALVRGNPEIELSAGELVVGKPVGGAS